jgi:allantoinase
MTGHDLVVAARRVVTGHEIRPARVGIRAGRIETVAPWDAELPAAATVVLADDAVLLPGLVDTHVHVNEPGRTEWEGFGTATAAAAAGGITTILDMPLNSLPPTVDPDALAVKRAAADGQVHVDVGFWGGAVPGNLGALTALLDAGAYGVKCFLLDSGVPEFPPLDPGRLRAALTELSTVDGLLIAHCEDPATVRPSPHSRDYGAFLASRPPEA